MGKNTIIASLGFARSGKRTLAGVEVQRSWFALPGQRWRWDMRHSLFIIG